MLVVQERQAIEGQRLLDILVDRAPVVEPAQLLQAVVVGLARQVVEGVAQEVDIASLKGGLGEDLTDARAKPGMIVGDDELDAMQASPAQAKEEVLPG